MLLGIPHSHFYRQFAGQSKHEENLWSPSCRLFWSHSRKTISMMINVYTYSSIHTGTHMLISSAFFQGCSSFAVDSKKSNLEDIESCYKTPASPAANKTRIFDQHRTAKRRAPQKGDTPCSMKCKIGQPRGDPMSGIVHSCVPLARGLWLTRQAVRRTTEAKRLIHRGRLLDLFHRHLRLGAAESRRVARRVS